MEEVAGAQRQRETRGKRQVGCQRSPKIAQVNQQFGPFFHHVFDAVLRHGRPSAQNHGAAMAKKNTPIAGMVQAWVAKKLLNVTF